MVFSILCYIIVGLLLSFWGKQVSLRYCRIGKTKNIIPTFNEYLFFLLFTFFLFYGLRSKTTGQDTHNYIDFYESFIRFGRFERDNIEPAHIWLTQIYGTIGIPTWVFLGTYGLVQISFTLLCIKKQHFLYPYVCAYIILGPVFLEWANIMRQCAVASIFLFSIKYIEERKVIKYLIAILICSLIHKSAIILIPLYWILQYRLYPGNKYIRIVILMVSIFIGQSNTWISQITIISDGLGMIGLGDYTEHLDSFIAQERDMAFGPSRISLLIVSICVILIMPQIIRRLHLPKKFDLYFSLYFIGICAYNIFANTSELFLRPIQYFTNTGVVLVPLLLYYLIKRKYQFLSLLYGFLIYWYSTYVSIKAYLGGAGAIDPSVYTFSFLQ